MYFLRRTFISFSACNSKTNKDYFENKQSGSNKEFLLITRQFICASNLLSVKRDAAQKGKKSASLWFMLQQITIGFPPFPCQSRYVSKSIPGTTSKGVVLWGDFSRGKIHIRKVTSQHYSQEGIFCFYVSRSSFYSVLSVDQSFVFFQWHLTLYNVKFIKQGVCTQPKNSGKGLSHETDLALVLNRWRGEFLNLVIF